MAIASEAGSFGNWDHRRTSWREPHKAPSAIRRHLQGRRRFVVIGVVAVSLFIGLFSSRFKTSERATPLVLDDTSTSVELAPPEFPSVATPTFGASDDSVATPQFKPQIPVADMSGNDFTQITFELLNFNEWLRAHPDPALVDTIYEHGSPAWNHVANDMRQLAKHPEVAQDVDVVDVNADPVTNAKSMKVQASVSYGENRERLLENIAYVRHDDGTWRATDRTVKALNS